MIVCFDTETTGFDKEFDELLQITIVDEKCNVLFESYIKPTTRKSWINAEKVNRISYDMVKDAPSAREIAPQIKEIFDKADKIVGYNVGFDVGFVETKCRFNIDTQKVEDSLKIFRKECTKLKVNLSHHKLGDAVDFYCPEAKADYIANAHDASCDAIATMRVYLAQIDKDRPRHFTRVKELSGNALKYRNLLLNDNIKEESLESDVNEEADKDEERGI